jgi:multidrug efflux system outer membrane protein
VANFKGGQIRANIHAKQEEEQQTYYAYQKAVLGAVKDVEDALIRYTTEQQRLVALAKAVTFGRSSLRSLCSNIAAGSSLT